MSPSTRQFLSGVFPLAAAAARSEAELDDLLDAWLADDMIDAGILDSYLASEEAGQ